MSLSAAELSVILHRIGNGCQEAKDELVRHLREFVRGVLRRHLGHNPHAQQQLDDLEQNVWVEYISSIHYEAIKAPCSLEKFLGHIARNRARQSSRHEHARKRDCRRNVSLEGLSGQQQEQLQDHSPGPSEQAYLAEIWDSLLESFSGTEREILERLLAGDTQEEAARWAGVSARSVGRIRAQARMLLDNSHKYSFDGTTSHEPPGATATIAYDTCQGPSSPSTPLAYHFAALVTCVYDRPGSSPQGDPPAGGIDTPPLV